MRTRRWVIGSVFDTAYAYDSYLLPMCCVHEEYSKHEPVASSK